MKASDANSTRERFRQFPISLTETQIERLEEIREEMGLSSRADIIRHLIVTHPTYRGGYQQP